MKMLLFMFLLVMAANLSFGKDVYYVTTADSRIVITISVQPYTPFVSKSLLDTRKNVIRIGVPLNKPRYIALGTKSIKVRTVSHGH